jgi:predicted PurR-regulated permease PerM
VAIIGPASFLLIRIANEALKLADRITAMGQGKGLQFVQSIQEFWSALQGRFPALQGVDATETLKASILDLSKQLASIASGLVQNLIAFVALVAVVLVAVFFILRDGPALVAWLRRLSPLDVVTTDRLFEEIRVLTEGSVTATFMIAIVQGILGGITTAILGLPSPLLWATAFGFCSFVPLIGAGLVWIPAVLWLVTTGHHGKALAMILVSVVIIAQTDNVIRPALVSGRSRLSFEVSMLSVLGGEMAFGMLGLVLGPVVVVVLTAIVDVYLCSHKTAGSEQVVRRAAPPAH